MHSEKEKIEMELERQIKRILTEVRQFVNADAGSIYVREGDSLRFRYTQNDTLQKRLPKGDKLDYQQFKIPINENSIPGYVALTCEPLNIPDVYTIEPTKPYRFSDIFDKEFKYRTCSTLTVPLLKNNGRKGNIIGILEIINAQDESGHVIPFSKDAEEIMLAFCSHAAIVLKRAKLNLANLERASQAAKLCGEKESQTNRVKLYVQILARRLRHNPDYRLLDDNTIDILSECSLTCDIGMIGISDHILRKDPNQLTEEELEQLKKHTIKGAQLFSNESSEYDRVAAEIALNHHERWDGTGYPRGLKEKDIPLSARIVAIADIYDTLRTNQIYRSKYTHDQAKEEITKNRGRKFDPDIVDAFLDEEKEFRRISSKKS